MTFPEPSRRLSLGLSNHKSSLTNRVDEKRKSGNRSTCWAHFCGVALKLRLGTYQIQYTWHQTWLTFGVNSEYILLVFALHTHQFDFFKCRIVFWPSIAVYEADERPQASHTFRFLQSSWWIKFLAKYCQVKSWPWGLPWVISYNVTVRWIMWSAECGVWKMRSVENEECGKWGVWKRGAWKSAECGKCVVWKLRSV